MSGTSTGPAVSIRPDWAFAPAVAPMDQTTTTTNGNRTSDEANARANQSLDDAALISATARHDRKAFEILYRRYASRLGGYLYKYLHRQDLVEEAFNDVMVVVWSNAQRFDGRAKVSTWLFGIAHNKALKTLERVRRHRGVDSFEDEATPDLEQLESFDGASNPERQASLSESSAALDDALKSLSADHRAVIELTFNEGLSYPEIASLIGVPVNTVKTRMFHARKRLTEALAAKEQPAPSADEAGARPGGKPI